MYIYLMLATLSMPRIDVEVNNKDCVIKEIMHDGINSYIHLVGNCREVYKRCNPKDCIIREAPPHKELNFGKKNVG